MSESDLLRFIVSVLIHSLRWPTCINVAPKPFTQNASQLDFTSHSFQTFCTHRLLLIMAFGNWFHATANMKMSIWFQRHFCINYNLLSLCARDGEKRNEWTANRLWYMVMDHCVHLWCNYCKFHIQWTSGFDGVFVLTLAAVNARMISWIDWRRFCFCGFALADGGPELPLLDQCILVIIALMNGDFRQTISVIAETGRSREKSLFIHVHCSPYQFDLTQPIFLLDLHVQYSVNLKCISMWTESFANG